MPAATLDFLPRATAVDAGWLVYCTNISQRAHQYVSNGHGTAGDEVPKRGTIFWRTCQPHTAVVVVVVVGVIDKNRKRLRATNDTQTFGRVY